MYTFKQNLVSKDKYPIKCPYNMETKYITVHDTANSAPATNEIQYMITNNNEVSFHIAVDETQAIQGLPFDRNSWSCGDGGAGTGNRNSISVEICRPTNADKSLYTQAEENAVYVVARLLYANNLSIEKLKKHQDWANKTCPHVILSENRWEGFKGRVQWVLDEIKKGNIEAALEMGTTGLKNNANTEVTTDTPFLVKIICDELNIRKEASFDSKVVGVVKKGEVFTIVDQQNGLYKLKSGAGWISAGSKYVQKIYSSML